MLLRIVLLIMFVPVLITACKRPLAEKIEKLIRDHDGRVSCKIDSSKCE